MAPKFTVSKIRRVLLSYNKRCSAEVSIGEEMDGMGIGQ